MTHCNTKVDFSVTTFRFFFLFFFIKWNFNQVQGFPKHIIMSFRDHIHDPVAHEIPHRMNPIGAKFKQKSSALSY